MSAKTAWWFCGNCGFQNHPRKNQDPNKCEQCGHDSKADPRDDDVDYTPRDRS